MKRGENPCARHNKMAKCRKPQETRNSPETGNVNDFAHEGKLAAYFGIVPRVQDSNETEHRGRITKRGSKLGRTALVQCALIAKRYSPYLHRYYERIRARRGTGKAIIALARKL